MKVMKKKYSEYKAQVANCMPLSCVLTRAHRVLLFFVKFPSCRVGIKINLTLFLCLINYGVWGSGGIALRILGFGTRWNQMASFMSRLFQPYRKEYGCQMDRRLGETQNLCGSCGKEINLSPEPSNLCPIIIPTDVSRLSENKCSEGNMKHRGKCEMQQIYFINALV
jgi:hypothetical protein